jgi:hypothetical protein
VGARWPRPWACSAGRRSDGSSSVALSRANAWLLNHAGNERPNCWSLAPEPGAIYPMIAQLEDEGLVTTWEEGGRRLVTLTSERRADVEECSARLGDPLAAFVDAPNRPDLRVLLHQLHVAVRRIGVGGDATQVEAAGNVLVQAWRSLYLILAGEAEGVGEGVKAVPSLLLAHASQLADRFSRAQSQLSF